MTKEELRPFQTIESALEFMHVLDSVIEESRKELQLYLSEADTERYKTGLNLALYKVDQLIQHVHKSTRILNDLTLIRHAITGTGVPKADHVHPTEFAGVALKFPS